MPKINITTADGDEETIIVNGIGSAELSNRLNEFLQAHGYDPDAVSASVPQDADARFKKLEQAAGVGGEGKRGIASRIDELENRVAELESKHS